MPEIIVTQTVQKHIDKRSSRGQEGAAPLVYEETIEVGSLKKQKNSAVYIASTFNEVQFRIW
jgi:hypothetical protein